MTTTSSIAWAGWYSITRGLFWAAWLAEPSRDPWRTPDRVGYGPPEDAERWIRSKKGQGAPVRLLDQAWAAAALRETEGQAPRCRPRRGEPPPPVYQTTAEARRVAEEREAVCARLYWMMRDYAIARDQPEPEPRFFGFPCAPPRPSDMGPPPSRPRKRPRRRAQGGAVPPCAPRSPFDVLGLDASASPSPDDVRRAYRRIVSSGRLHPDQGGDAAAFRAVTAAREEAVAHVEGRAGR